MIASGDGRLKRKPKRTSPRQAAAWKASIEVKAGPRLRYWLSYSPTSGTYKMEREPVFVFPVASMLLMFNELEKIFGSGSYSILFKAGESLGSSSAKLLLERGMGEKEVLNRFYGGRSRLGFGNYRVKRMTERARFGITFELHNTPLFEEAVANSAFLFFLHGIYSGYFKQILRKEVKVEHKVLEAQKAIEFRVVEAA